MFTGLREEDNKDSKDRYRKVMVVLKEVKMGQVEGGGNGAGYEQQMVYLILREQWKEHGSIARGRRMHMAASGPPLDKKGDYIRGGSEKRA